MAKMGESTLKEMERVVAVVAGGERRKSQPNNGREMDANNIGIDQEASSAVENGKSWLSERPFLHELTWILDYRTSTAGSTSQMNGLLAPIQDFDPSIFDSLTDVDLFDMFDPTFDLNGVDAALQGNLDLSFPTQFR
jgi:hypothetical protein